MEPSPVLRLLIKVACAVVIVYCAIVLFGALSALIR